MQREVRIIQNYYWIIFFVILLCCIILPTRRMFMLNIIRRKRKGVKRDMPTEMLKEFIGKDCAISMFNEVGAVQGKILAIEENWIKVEEKKKIRIINGDMIRDISTAK